MPTVSGFISISFSPVYLGQHRVCWREGIVGPYTCALYSCSPAVDPCTVQIPVTFDTNTCQAVNYNGYVQAACEDPNTTDGAVFWNQDFEPVVDCDPYVITCLGLTTQSGNLEFDDIEIRGNTSYTPNNQSSAANECICNNNLLYQLNLNLAAPPLPLNNTTLWPPGTHYCGVWNGREKISPCSTPPRAYNPCAIPNQNPALFGITCSVATPCYPFYCNCIFKPTVTISAPPPGGTQATAELIMGFGGVKTASDLLVLNTGSGGVQGTYNNVQPINNLIQPGNIIGYGRQSFTVVIDVSGKIQSVTPTPGVNGYYFFTSAGQQETFSFNPASIGGCTNTLIQVKPGGTDFGDIKGLLITDPGSGYTNPPTLTINANSCYSFSIGIDGVINVNSNPVINPCPSFFPGEGCQPFTVELPIIPPLQPGTSFTLCYPHGTIPTIPRPYEVELADPGCCYDCVALQVTSPSVLNQIVFTDCNSGQVQVDVLGLQTAVYACVVNNSWAASDPDTSFTVVGPCFS